MYVLVTGGNAELYSLNALYQKHPNVSFPENPSDALLEKYNVYPVKISAIPTFDNRVEYIKTSNIYQQNDEWCMNYVVEPLPIEQASDNIRNDRNKLLTDTDWIITKCYEQGEPVSESWQSYRQNLRDLTSQQGFPYSVEWPVAPE